MKKILVALDGSEHSERALKLSAEMAENNQAKLIMVHVIDDKPLDAEEREFAEVEFSERMRSLGIEDDALVGIDAAGLSGYLQVQNDRTSAIKQVIGRELLQHAERKFSQLDGVEIKTVLSFGDPAEQILEAAEANDADLIVIGSRGLSDLKGLWLGSVSHKISNLSPINVVTVR